ncbi:hypothetical protein [Natronorubrum thiooxidans]|uniref:Uncharacterized protein n=1 Tax=Natronorubrum thiooxidans TaxID=308853 RepID=A0A1N7GX99_9EURY|nr:hypothetical protein [Natronorubrum thiooxidans]SIS17211.1 hypothetical protein SAMN05421752_11721 [Natronorubrum thiooxidans]
MAESRETPPTSSNGGSRVVPIDCEHAVPIIAFAPVRQFRVELAETPTFDVELEQPADSKTGREQSRLECEFS